jgi:hypothetical protein
MAFTLNINGTPHEVDVDGDTPPVCRFMAHRVSSRQRGIFDRFRGDADIERRSLSRFVSTRPNPSFTIPF